MKTNKDKSYPIPHIRWMIRRDTPEVLKMEESTRFPISEEDILNSLRQRNCIGMVAEVGEKVIGYMMYELHKTRLELLRMVVHPDFRRQQVGGHMCAKLESKLSSHRRTSVGFDVSEYDDDMHVFLRSQGYKSQSVNRRAGPQYDDTYRFVFGVEESLESVGVATIEDIEE